ncbi:O-methyltransferase-domain-containing protein [Crepidotus variabilis]|uniref:O-methyltransferase-domain-containing protein n=1 Tax=Crepidotus variabilis TaxID=179855 RepID=A0A9P6ELL0_9AGAR|nr:O-methyltransferase-domain-containing protein [Crepidotus variabilis]
MNPPADQAHAFPARVYHPQKTSLARYLYIHPSIHMSNWKTDRERTSSLSDWTQVEEYSNSFLVRQDDAFNAIQHNDKNRGLPDIAVSANQGKFLYLLAKTFGARRCLEVGTLGGFSTAWMARAVPDDGKVVTFELNENYGKIARENWKIAGVSDKISLVLGSATETLVQYDPKERFDLAFIDADKEHCLLYFREAKRLVRKGGVIIVDNVVRYGKVADPSYQDHDTNGVRDLLKAIQSDDDVDATSLNTVGSKGLDGFLYALLK